MQMKILNAKGAKPQPGKGRGDTYQKGKGGTAGGGKEQMTADSLEADLNIPQELKEIIEDSEEDDEKAMPLRFTDPNELMEIFSTLEESNLFMIELCQDVEMQFEEKKLNEKNTKNTFSSQIEVLKSNEEQNNIRIDKT